MAFYDSLQPIENTELTSSLVWHTDAVFSLGDVIRKCRTAKRPRVGLVKLAAAAGLNKATLSRVERNEIDPHLSTLQRIADALGVELWVLIRQASDPRSAQHGEGADVTAAAIEQRDTIKAIHDSLAPAFNGVRTELDRLNAFIAEQTRKRG